MLPVEPGGRPTNSEDAPIATASRKDAKRPLPAHQRPPTSQDFAALSLEWRRSRLSLAYEKYGRKDAKWDAAARNYLERLARRPADPLDAMIVAGQAVIDAGCDDPLVCCQHGERLLQRGQSAAAEPFLLHALLSFESSDYPKC